MTNTLKIKIVFVTNQEQLAAALQIRKKVFVEEQHVPENEEYDEFEEKAGHFLAFFNDIPCGTARWRFTEKGVKLERFAVLKEYRNKGIGHSLVETVLKDVKENKNYRNHIIYLNAQITAMPLYRKSGFKEVGDMFLECGIKHFQMIKT